MYKVLLLILLLSAPLTVRAQYIVSDYGDLGDSTLDDGIYFPKTLRSAIQNANYKGVPASIEIAEDTVTINVGTFLPEILVRMELKGDGVRIQPTVPEAVDQGLVFRGDGSKIRMVIIQNFKYNGLVWRANDGEIENVTCRFNGNCNLQVWEAHRNKIGTDVMSNYASNWYYGGEYGIFLYRANDNIVHRNYVGIDGDHNDFGNTHHGIVLDKCNRTTVRYNTVSGNNEYGIEVDGYSSDDESKFHSSGNYIYDNTIGMNSDFGQARAISNGFSGIMVRNSSHDTIRKNVVSGNLGAGIQVQASRPGNSIPIDGFFVIDSNKVGVARDGKTAIPNGSGIGVAAKNCIIRHNLVSGNTNVGISIEGTENILQSNIVGLDLSQAVAVPNGSGIAITNSLESGHAVVGDTVGEAGNIVAGNVGDGIYVYAAGTRRVIVSRNMIGINKDTIAFPNGGDGIHMKYSLQDIVARENMIGANGRHGINIERNVVIFLDTNTPPMFQRPSNITVTDNCIGCVRYGDTTGRHGGAGIATLNAHSITIHRNVIVGTQGDGIRIGDSTQLVDITANWIGPEDTTDRSQLIGGDGIHVRGRTTSTINIGKSASTQHRNDVKFCRGYAVAVRDSAQIVTVLESRFLDNQLGGIALDDLAKYFSDGQFNDDLDADHGSNELQNTLEQYSGYTKDRKLWINGEFRGKPNTAYRTDVYLAKALPEIEAYRTQGTYHYGWFSFTTDGLGKHSIDTSFEEDWIGTHSTEYPFATVTISGVEGTSAFSHLGTPPLTTDVVVKIDTQLSKVEENGRVTIQATIRNLGGNPATTVSVRDTTRNFDLESVTISKGVALIADSTFIATIPSLAFGEVIEYKAVGKARSVGPHHRRVHAIPSENDENPANNADTVLLMVTGVSAVDANGSSDVRITASGNILYISGLPAGDYVIRSHDLLGRELSTSEATGTRDEVVKLELQHGVNLIEITRDGSPFYLAKVILSH